MATEHKRSSVPVSVAAKVYGKDAAWVRAGIIKGWLPIGTATRNGELVTDISEMNSKYGRINYYISPKKLFEDTGFIWEKEVDVQYGKNGEGYPDPTAWQAIRNVEKTPETISDLVVMFKALAEDAGYEITNRIIFRDLETGKEWR